MKTKNKKTLEQLKNTKVEEVKNQNKVKGGDGTGHLDLWDGKGWIENEKGK